MRLMPDPALKTYCSMVPGQNQIYIYRVDNNSSITVNLLAPPEDPYNYASIAETSNKAMLDSPVLCNYIDALTHGRDKIFRLPDYLFETKGFKGLDVLQKESVSYILSGQDTLLADEQGTGKTITALAASTLCGAPRTLIICPQIVKGNWEAEITRWCGVSSYTYKPNQQHAFQRRYTIVNYDLLDKFLVSAKDVRFDFLIVDECHYIKRGTSKRTQNILERLHKIPMRVFMSGTPLDMPYDLFPILHSIRPNRRLEGHDFATDQNHFIQRYCGGYKTRETRVRKDGTSYSTPPAWTLKGSSNEGELNSLLLKHCMIRHRAPKWSAKEMVHEFMRLDLEDYAPPADSAEASIFNEALLALRVEENSLNRLASSYLNSLINEISAPMGYRNHSSATNDEAIARTLFAVANGSFGRGVVPPFDKISSYRQALGVAKTPAAVSFITNFFNVYPKRKLVVFTAHKQVAKTLAANPLFAKYKPVTLTGDDKAEEKTANVKTFQEDSECRLIVCNSAAANMGVTLTAAHDILHVEMEWSGFRLAQSNARIDRRGQTKGCRAFYLVVANSLDLHMTKVVHKKSRSASRVLGDIEAANLSGEEVTPVAIENTPHLSSLHQELSEVETEESTLDFVRYWRADSVKGLVNAHHPLDAKVTSHSP